MTLYFNRLQPSQVTTSGGRWVYTTTNIRGILMHLIVRASTSTTTFDFQIQDNFGVTLYERQDIDGEINEQMAIPVKGQYTLRINDASKDEGFNVYMAIREI